MEPKDNATVIGVNYSIPPPLPGLEAELQTANFVIPKPNARLTECLDIVAPLIGNVEIRSVQMLGGAIVLPDPGQIPLLEGEELPI